ncbi:hypothetical protein H4Q26_007961 [Puccinia striiformis f. sp. tritici PST-130]|nr:hypothetical protein H4Q26_007961 [Puccinia striiformis f. sp. tritici PST-130]
MLFVKILNGKLINSNTAIIHHNSNSNNHRFGNHNGSRNNQTLLMIERLRTFGNEWVADDDCLVFVFGLTYKDYSMK